MMNWNVDHVRFFDIKLLVDDLCMCTSGTEASRLSEDVLFADIMEILPGSDLDMSLSRYITVVSSPDLPQGRVL